MFAAPSGRLPNSLTKWLKALLRGEEVGRDLTAGDHVGDGHPRGEALRIGDQPLLELEFGAALENESNAAGRVARLILERDRERAILAFHADDAGVTGKVDGVGQEHPERRRLNGI